MTKILARHLLASQWKKTEFRSQCHILGWVLKNLAVLEKFYNVMVPLRRGNRCAISSELRSYAKPLQTRQAYPWKRRGLLC